MLTGVAGERGDSNSIHTSIARSAGSLDLLLIPRVPLLHPGLSARGLLRRPSSAVAEQLHIIKIKKLYIFLPFAFCLLISLNGFYLEADIHCRGGMRERADRDQVNSSFSIIAHICEIDAA